MVVRHAVAALLAMCVTFALFYLMQALIALAEGRLSEVGAATVVDFVRLQRDSELELKKRRMPDKEPPEEPPPPPEIDLSRAARPDLAVGGIPIGIGELEIAGAPDLAIAASDTDVVPVVRVTPTYPIRAQERGIEGWVEVEFTISAAGTVKDPQVIEGKPKGIFDRAALRAIAKWKYRPKIEDGEPVERPGIRARLTFELTDR